MNSATLPDYLTHYYVDRPFQTLTALEPTERAAVIDRLAIPPNASGRLRSSFYFEQRLRCEALMHEQFIAKGGRPMRRHPHYAVLGESEIWAEIAPRSVRVSLTAIHADQVSFTFTDSWSTYVDCDLVGHMIPRKPQYGQLYRVEELEALFQQHGWPGERWKTEPAWEHDLYVEAQLWGDVPAA